MICRTENYHPQVPSDTDAKLASLMLACWRPVAASRPVSKTINHDFEVAKLSRLQTMEEIVRTLGNEFASSDWGKNEHVTFYLQVKKIFRLSFICDNCNFNDEQQAYYFDY